MWLIILVVAAVIIFIWYKNPATTVTPAPALNNSASQSTSQNAMATVSISNFAFNGSSIQVKKGTTVVWTNVDGAAHTVTSDSGAFTSASLQRDGSFSYTFTNTGTFPYHCALHPSMHGIVNVIQ